MKRYDELHEGQILYTANEEAFWEYDKDSEEPDGIMPKHTKIKVKLDDSPEVIFEVLEGEFSGKMFMWGWGDSDAKPEDLLTEKEYAELTNNAPMWKIELDKVVQCPQRQDATLDQLSDLYLIANKFGFYDAADYIRQNFIKN